MSLCSLCPYRTRISVTEEPRTLGLNQSLDQEDSTSSSDEENNPPTDEPDQMGNFALCMVLEINDEHPKAWKQAVNESNSLEAMENEVNKLKGKKAWELERTNNMKVLPGVWSYRV